MRAGATLVLEAGPEADVVLRVRGIVQGVGYRPFVHRLALRLGLRGWVRNDAQGVLIRVVGFRSAIAALAAALTEEAPAAARVMSVDEEPLTAQLAPPGDAFVILDSPASPEVETAAPPDLALCPQCRAELLDPANRRHGYPFITCTQCGPRYSIIERLPYDRPRTTMRAFRQCPQCQAEYDDPADRRYHAQPNACPACGPHVFYQRAGAPQVEIRDPIGLTADALALGDIVAVKGIGGFHLLVDARNAEAVGRLRQRKRREEKPFAVLFPDLAAIAERAEVTEEAAQLLQSPAAPIVLLRRRPGADLAAGVAPGNPWIGAFLPSAPLHVLLLEAFGEPVVATSGNLSDEPLCIDGMEARSRLAGIADAFLDHDRPIAHPVDDSVVRLSAAGPIRLRRARGYAPAPLRLPGPADGRWLCVGAQMKAAIAVAAGDRLTVSPHLGDMDHPASREAFQRAVQTLGELHGSTFTRVVCDRHPDYASTRFAEKTGLPLVAVQHHLAHVLACLLEHGRGPDNVLGVAWDGTGYGEDGTIWGGEFILLRAGQALRFARLRPFRLAGGEAAVRDGRRAALALAWARGGKGFDEAARFFGFSEGESASLHRMLERGVNSPVTTSAGRLFDAVGALLGLGGSNRFEGQAALAVEAAAEEEPASGPALEFPVRPLAQGQGAFYEVDWEPVFEAVSPRGGKARPAAESAAAFHRGLAEAIVSVARLAGVGTIALSGGCFQNARLAGLAAGALRQAGFQALFPRDLPPNDGAIAAGQALGALWNLTTVALP